MATYYARKAGNINAADVWATTPSGTAAAVTFASGDVLVANSFAIAINVDTNLGGAGQVRNDTLGGATAGGTFTLNAGVTLTANVLHNTATGGATVVTFAANAPNVAYIVGNVSSPLNTSGGTTPINISGNGTLFFTGNATGDLKSVLGGAGGAIQIASGGTLNFTGNATGGGGAAGYAIYNSTTGNVNITGNCMGAGAPAVANNSTTGIVTISGQAIGSTTTGGGAGVINLSTGGVTVKRAIGGSYGPGSTGVSAAPGVSNSSTGLVTVEEIEFGTNGMSPTSGGGIRLKKASTNVALFNYCDTAGAKTLIDATANAAMPAASNVRSGVSYASGALTGSCAVPAAGSVALGVPVDASTGTAVLTAAAIRTELAVELARIDAAVSSRLAPSGTLATVTTLTNAPTVPTAAAIATQVRSELSVELGRVDSAVSSRLASADYTTPPTTSAIATAVEGSLLNEADGQAVLNALVGAIGNSNVDEIALVAAIRSDLERNGGKLINLDAAISSRLAAADYTAPTSAPTAASVANAVWGAATKEITGGTVTTLTNSPDVPTEAEIASQVRTELAVELGRIDAAISSRLAPSGTLATVTTLTNAPSVPSAAAIADEVRVELATELARLDAPVSGATAPSAATVATAVRTELATELARVDVAVGTRLAGSAYTAPANSDVAAIKAKTDALNTERLANVATTAIVGNLIAQANS